MSLEQIINSLDQEISRLQRARAILGDTAVTATGRRRRHMSATARARIAASQKARWAKVKAAQKKK